MSFLKHKNTAVLNVAPRLPKATINQLEILRRAFELRTTELVADLLEEAIQNEFDRRMAEVEAIPAMDSPEAEFTPGDRFLYAVLAATRTYFRQALTPEQQAIEFTRMDDDKIARALNHAAGNSEDPGLAFMRFAPIGSTEPGGNGEIDSDAHLCIIGARPAEDAA